MWKNIEFTDSSFIDRTSDNGHNGINVVGSGNKVINCFLRNFPQGLISGHGNGLDLIVHGCLFYYNGWNSSNGHGLYPQNSAITYKTMTKNIVFNNGGYGFHLYGSTGGVDNFWLEGNTAFDNGTIGYGSPLYNYHIGGTLPSTGHVLKRNYGYGASTRVGYGSGNVVSNVSIQDNVFDELSSMALTTCVPIAFDGNKLYGPTSGFDVLDWLNNVYGALGALPDAYYLEANEYNENRANLTIFNQQEEASTINVNVGSIFGQTGTVEVHNVQDYFVDIQTLTITAGVIVVNMQAVNRTVETPVGWEAPATTFPQFGCFVIEKV